MTFDRGTVYYLKKCLRLLTLTATAQLTPTQRSYQQSKQEIEFHMMEEIHAALTHVYVCRKDDIFRQRGLIHSGGGTAFRIMYPARAYTPLVVLSKAVKYISSLEFHKQTQSQNHRHLVKMVHSPWNILNSHQNL